MRLFGKPLEIPRKEDALPGRSQRMRVAPAHYVTKQPLDAPFEGYGRILVAMGCFWGAERKFWQAPGVHTTAVGYAAGITPNPTYEEVCEGVTGHAEVVQIHFDPAKASFKEIVDLFYRSMMEGDGLQRLWARLDQLQRDAVAEVVHSATNRFVDDAFRAKYGGDPH